MRHTILRLSIWLIIGILLLGISAGDSAAQSSMTLVGYISILHGDPPANSNQPPQQFILLSDHNGMTLAQLDMDYAQALALLGREIRLTATVTGSGLPGTLTANLPALAVQTITPTGTNVALPAASGAYPWVNLLCKFKDVATVPTTDYNALFSATYPGVDHFWRQNSYNAVTLTGTTTDTMWRELPQPRSYYVPATGYANLDRLVTDCIAVSNASVNFALYKGINMMFNASLDCCAWGGSRWMTLDGLSKVWSVTWLPPWAQVYDYITHEMGHGFGLPHSSGPQVNPPSGLDIYISSWDVMSDSGGTCSVWDSFGCLPPGIIADHMTIAGWMPTNRRVTVPPGTGTTVTLERLRNPLSSVNPLMIKIPINGSSSHYYTVEARFRTSGQQDYDQNIPDTAVIIHDVLLGRGGWPGTNTGPALVVVDDPTAGSPGLVVNGEGARWKPGETFQDAAAGIKISVISQNASSFVVTVSNQVPGAPALTAPGSGATVTSAAPTFTWRAERYAAGYEIAVDTTSTFTSGAVITAQTTGTSYTAPVLAANRSYYWRVRTKIAGGSWSDWSTVSSFILNSPAAAAPLRTQLTTITPTLRWNLVNWAIGYKVEISRSASFSTVSDSQTVNGTNTLSLPTAPLANGLYYWRVCPQRANGTFGTCSSPDTFVINVP